MGMATTSGQEKQHLVGVISDTHGLVRLEAVRTLEGADFLIHAGDIGKPQPRSEKIIEGFPVLSGLGYQLPAF